MTATTPGPLEHRVGTGAFDARSLLTSLPDAVRKLDPRVMWRSPVMFVVLIGAVLTTVAAIAEPSAFAWWISGWLWLTVVFANLAEAVAEGRGRAQAATLRATRRDTTARRLSDGDGAGGSRHVADASETSSSARPATSSPVTATSSRAWPASTSRPSPASRHRSSARAGETGAP